MACVEPGWNGTKAFGTTVDVKDPVQGGMLKNCSLIAGIASLSWKQKIGVQPGPTYTFNFYRKVNGVTITDPQQTDGIIPNPLQAKSDDPTEFWPSLYEKAYYQWLEQLGLTKPSARPKYCSHTEWQDPSTVLFQLTGKTVNTKSCTDWNTVFNDINGFCTNCARSIINRSINSPAVAWTYDPTISNPNNAAYSDATIAARHTYSLLGVVNLGTTLDKRFIVMRNPHGKSKGDPNMPGYLYTSAPWCNNIILGESDGIFALRIDQFVKYFEKYAWTTV
jgi:hypothetical protein